MYLFPQPTIAPKGPLFHKILLFFMQLIMIGVVKRSYHWSPVNSTLVKMLVICFSMADKMGKDYTPSFHDATFNRLFVFHHYFFLLKYLNDAARKYVPEAAGIEDDNQLIPFMPYEVLVEADGGPDHYFTLKNVLALLSLFLRTNLDKLVAMRGFPRLSYLKTVESAFTFLNIGLANLSLKIQSTDWMMKMVRKAIYEHDEQLSAVIKLMEKEDNATHTNNENITNDQRTHQDPKNSDVDKNYSSFLDGNCEPCIRMKVIIYIS